MWQLDGMRSGLYTGWGRSSNFNFQIISVVAAVI